MQINIIKKGVKINIKVNTNKLKYPNNSKLKQMKITSIQQKISKKTCRLQEQLFLSTALLMLMISSGSAPVTQLLL